MSILQHVIGNPAQINNSDSIMFPISVARYTVLVAVETIRKIRPIILSRVDPNANNLTSTPTAVKLINCSV
jgi:hypothetical protein